MPNAGYAYRLGFSSLQGEFNRGGNLQQQLLLRYTQTLITQMAQSAVCKRRHTIDQQLCRWLLLSLDRLPSNELTVPQEHIANKLDLRRERVSEAASPGLERRACECYRVVKRESDRLLSRAMPGAK